MKKFKDAESYINALKNQSIRSIINERSDFKSYLDDESPDHHFQMLWIMINDMLENSQNIVAESKKIYEFTLFTPKYDNIDLSSYFSDEIILLIYKKLCANDQSKSFGIHALVQFLLPQKKAIAFSLLKRIITIISKNSSGNENDQQKAPLLSIVSFYTKLEYMKLSIHYPQEITSYISDIFKFLESYQTSRISNHLATLPVYFFFKIVKFLSKILNKNPEANPSSLIRLLSLQPIILISYRLPTKITFDENLFPTLAPLSTFQAFLPNEFPQFLTPYYYRLFLTIFEFFVIFSKKSKPSINDSHDIKIISDTFDLVSRCESGKDSFLLCLSFFMKSQMHVYVLFRLYQYLEMKEKSIIHDYCVMIFTIALDCHYLPHTRTVLKSKHRVYFIKVISAIEKNYKHSPFRAKVSFIKQILVGEAIIPDKLPLIQKYRLLLSSNNYDRRRQKILKVLLDSIQYLSNPDIYVHFCLLIINSIQKIFLQTISSDHLILFLSLFTYSHDFIKLPRFHYLQVLKFYALLCISNTSTTFRSICITTRFKDPFSIVGTAVVLSRFHPMIAFQKQQIAGSSNAFTISLIRKLAKSEMPHALLLLNDVITTAIHYYGLSFETLCKSIVGIFGITNASCNTSSSNGSSSININIDMNMSNNSNNSSNNLNINFNSNNMNHNTNNSNSNSNNMNSNSNNTNISNNANYNTRSSDSNTKTGNYTTNNSNNANSNFHISNSNSNNNNNITSNSSDNVSNSNSKDPASLISSTGSNSTNPESSSAAQVPSTDPPRRHFLSSTDPTPLSCPSFLLADIDPHNIPSFATFLQARQVMRIIASVSSVEGFDKFVMSYAGSGQILEVISRIGEMNSSTIPATPSFINTWRIIGSNQRKSENLLSSCILLSYNVNRSRFFFESLFQVVINMSTSLLAILNLDRWEVTPMFVAFIQCLPMNIKMYPELQRIKEMKVKNEGMKIEEFKKKNFQLMPLSMLSVGITGCYYNTKMELK